MALYPKNYNYYQLLNDCVESKYVSLISMLHVLKTANVISSNPDFLGVSPPPFYIVLHEIGI